MIESKMNLNDDTQEAAAFARYEEGPDGQSDVFYYHPGQEPEGSSALYLKPFNVAQLEEENAKLKEELKRLYGIERLFICGTAGEVGTDNMPESVLVSPQYGDNGYALYQKIKDYTPNQNA